MIWEGAFWAFAGLAAYSYLGYPALVLLLSRLTPARRVERAPIQPFVSVLIVARNEEAAIGARIQNILDCDYPEDRIEVAVASDGSKDATDEIVSAHPDPRVRLLRIEGHGGKARALNAAVPECSGEILVLADARQRFARDALRELVASFADETVGAVSGELHLETPSSADGVGFYWRYEKAIRLAESRLSSVVGATGAIYALRRELFVPLDPATILDDVALPLAVANAGYRVLFEPRAQAYDRLPHTPAGEFRRKVRTLAGNFQLVALQPSLVDPRRNRLFWQFVSHKLSRLAVPWCLLAMLVASGVLAVTGPRSALYAGLFAVQGTVWTLALVSWRISRLRDSHWLLSVPYALLMLNLAAASALFAFVMNTQKPAWRHV